MNEPTMRDEIRLRIQEGYAAAQLGELVDENQVRLLLGRQKQTWIRETADGGRAVDGAEGPTPGAKIK